MKSRLEEAQGGFGAYDVNHSLVERRIITKVGMAKEVQFQESVRSKLLEKPAVARACAEKLLAEKGRDKFYGPNLPVAWGDELMPPWKGRGEKEWKRRTKGGEEESDHGDESPTDEVLNHIRKS